MSNAKKLSILLLLLAMLISGCSAPALVETPQDLITPDAHGWTLAMSIKSGLQISFASEYPNISYCLKADSGLFYKNRRLLEGTEHVFSPADSIEYAPEYERNDNTQYFIEVRIRNGDDLIGYGLLGVKQQDTDTFYIMTLIKCVTFSEEVPGTVFATEEEVNERLQLARQQAAA